MRRLKWIVSGLFAVVVALLVAGYIVIANYDTEKLRALLQDEVKSATGRTLVIAGPIEFDISLSPTLVLEQVTLANGPGGKAANLASVGRLEIVVALWPLLSGDLEVQRLRLVEPIIALERTLEGAANWELAGQSSSGAMPAFQTVLVENAQITFEDLASGELRHIALSQLEATAQDLTSPLGLTAAGSLDALAFDLTATLSSAQSLMSDEGFSLEAEGTLADLVAKISGTIAPWDAGGNRLSLSLSGPSASTLMSALDLPLAPLGALSLAVEVVQQDVNTMAFSNLSTKLGESDLAGNATLGLGGERPKLQGAFASQRLVIAGLGLPSDESNDTGALPRALLQSLDLDLTLALGEVVWGARSLTAVQLPLRLEAGRLSSAPFSLGYQEGSIVGELTLDSQPQPAQASLVAQGTGLNMAELVGPELTGAADVVVDLTGEGDSLEALLGSLDGRTTLTLGSGQLDSRFFSILSASLGNVLLPLFDGSSTTAVNCGVARLDWTNGIGLNNGTLLDTANFTTTIAGQVFLQNDTVDLYVDTVGKGVSLAALAVPLRVTATFDDPIAVPDPAGSAVTAAKVAGLIVFPPAGIAALLADQQIRSGNACQAAVEKVDEGGGPSRFFADLFEGVGEAVDEAVEGAGDLIEDTGDAIEDGLDSLFGN